MLKNYHVDWIDQCFERLLVRQEAAPGGPTSIISRPEAIEYLAQLLADQAGPCRHMVIQFLENLQSLFGEEAERPPAVDPLVHAVVNSRGCMAAVRALWQSALQADPSTLPFVRTHIADETRPFVLSTMASILGQLGNQEDAQQLMPLLAHIDGRVVSNALQALHRLKVEVPAPLLLALLERPGFRIKAAAMAHLARTDVVGVLEQVAPIIRSPDAGARGAIAYLLGRIPQSEAGVALLVELLVAEETAAVSRQAVRSLRRQATSGGAALVTSALRAARASGGEEVGSLIDGLLERLACAPDWWEPTEPPARPLLVSPDPAVLAQPDPPPEVAGIAETLGHFPDGLGYRDGLMMNLRPERKDLTPEAALDEDLPLSFSSLWGTNTPTAPPPRLRPPSPPKPPAGLTIPPELRRTFQLAGAFLVGVIWTIIGRPDTQAQVRLKHEIMRNVRPSSSPRPSPSVAPSPSQPSPRGNLSFAGAGGGGRADSGAKVIEVEGIVVSLSTDSAILKGEGRAYMLRGPGVRSLTIGVRCRVRGVVVSIESSGLVIMEVSE